MENNLVGFKKYNGKKSDLLNITVEPGDIIFGIDSETNLPYIYHDGVFYSDASEWSEALPEIHIGPTMPPEKDPYIKLWVDTDDNPPTLKYKNSDTNDWEDVSSNIDITETNEIFIGDNLPADISDNIKVWYQTNVDLPEEDTVVSWEDINNKPEFADVAFTGDFNDLVNIPDFDLTRESCTIYASVDEEDPKHNLTHEQHLSNKDAFIKLRQSITDKQDIDITIVACYYSGEEVEYKDCYIKDVGYSSGTIINFQLESATIIQDINNPYLSYINISQFTNGNEYYQEGVTEPGTYVDISKTYLVSYTDLNKHTTTYIGTENPSTISSKYNLWVDTTNEEVVFKYKEGNEWKVLSTGGNGSIEVDTVLDPTSENPIANKAVYAMAVSVEEGFSEIDENLSKKANTENGLVEGRGFKVSDTKKYYLPGTTIPSDGVENTNILATKAEVLSNEVINSKATVYNLYAMDPLSEEQSEANAKALESVQNREVAIYKVYTNDDTYAIADVKLVPGPYLEAYVYVNNPDTTSKQATITKHTYTFDQAGEYMTGDKQEVIVPSLSKVEDMVGNSGGTNGLEIRILSDDTPEENLQTIELVKEGKALAGLADEFGISILTYLGDRKFSQTTYIEDWQVHIAGCIELGEDGNLISQAGYVLTGDLAIVDAIDFKLWLKWQTSLSQTTNGRNIRTIYVIEENQRCLVDSISFNSTTTELQYNYNDKRYKRVYTNETGEYTKEEIVVNSGGGTGGSSVGGLETRIVYIPNYTSINTTLTNEEKEYNLETCRKLLNGTARAALSLEGETAGVYALNTYCEDILDLSVLGEVGYYIPFKWTYMVQLGATIIGNDGDILLFGSGQATTVSDLIINEDLSNLGDIGSAAMEQYSGGKLPTVYYVENDMGSLLQLVPLHPFGMLSNLGVMFQGIGESSDGNTQTKYNLSCYNPATNVAHEFEATPIATKIYIGKPSTEHKNINKAFANKPFGVLGISPMPALVYEDASSAEILRWKSYQPLEKYIVPNLETGDWGDYTHIEFLIFREGKYERWKLDMEGETSLIE